jgi:hypothetical protein
MILVYDRGMLSNLDNWYFSDTPGTLAVSPTDSSLYTLFPGASNGGNLKILDPPTGVTIGGYDGLNCQGAIDIEFTGDGSRIYIMSSQSPSSSVIFLKSI